MLKIALAAGLFACALLPSCATTGEKPEQDAAAEQRQRELLSSQKALIRNAMDKGEHHTAIKSLKDLLRSHSDDPELNLLYGFSQLAFKHAAVAVGYIRKAYKLDPTPANGLNLSSAYIEAGDYVRARKLLFGLIKAERGKKQDSYPHPERFYHNIGLSFQRERKHKQAENAFKRALEENPAYYLSQYLLAKVYEDTGRKALARQTYGMILDQCSGCYDPMHSLVMSYMSEGMLKDADRTVSAYLKTMKLEEADLNRAKELKRLVLRSQGRLRQAH